MVLHVLSSAYRKPVKCVIRVGTARRVITEPYVFLKELVVDSRRDGPAMAVLHLSARRPAGSSEALREAGLFGVGEPIVLEADFDGRTEEVMRGLICDMEAQYPAGSDLPERVAVHCRDLSLRLDRQPVFRRWGEDEPVSDRTIAAAILNGYGLVLNPDGGEGKRRSGLEQADTDWRFLQRLARASGYECLFKGEDVYFGPKRLKAMPQGSIVVGRGPDAHCRRFSVGRDARRRLRGRKVWHHARGELDSLRYGHVLRVGEPVSVNGVGEPYDGIYYVDAVCHRFTRKGYRQYFELLRHSEEALGDFAVGFAPEVPGLLYEVL